MLIILIFLICFLPVSIVEGSPYGCLKGWAHRKKATLDKWGVTFHGGSGFWIRGYAFKGIGYRNRSWIVNALHGAAYGCGCTANWVYDSDKVAGICGTL